MTYVRKAIVDVVCTLCGSTFRGLASRKHCDRCKFIVTSSNYPLLTKGEKKISWKYNFKSLRRSCRARYSKAHPEANREAVKRYRKIHIEAWRKERNREKEASQALTLPTAFYSGSRWTRKDLWYLRKYSKKRTATQIARKLGRTYRAVITAACLRGIGLMSQEKIYNRLGVGSGLEDRR